MLLPGAAEATLTLSRVSGPYATGQTPVAVAFNPSGDLLATDDFNGHDIAIFGVDSADGSLTPVPGSPFPTAWGEGSLQFSPDGRLLATTTGPPTPGGAVMVMSVAPDGTISKAPGSPVASSGEPESLTFDPTGGLLAVTATSAVSVFDVGSDGELAPAPASPFGFVGIDSVAFSPAGHLLAAANELAGRVSLFSVDSTGTLNPDPVSSVPSARPTAVAFNPAGTLLAVASGGTLSVYAVAPDGTLTLVPDQSPAVGGGPIQFNPSGTLLVVGSGGPDIVMYGVDPTGHLTAIPGLPFGTTTVDTVSFALSPSGLLLAVATGADSSVSIYRLQPDPPTVTIAAPAAEEIVVRGSAQFISFTCADSPGGPGLVSCTDQDGAPAPQRMSLDTRTVGPHQVQVTAVSRDGQRATRSVSYLVVPSVGSVPGADAPNTSQPSVLRALRIAPRHLRAAGRGRGGAWIAFVDSAKGPARFSVLRWKVGVRRGAACVAPSRHRGGRAPARRRCARLVFVGGFTRTVDAGSNRIRFSGRLRGRALPPGAYFLMVTGAGSRSATTTGFRIVHGRPARHRRSAPPRRSR